MTNSGGKYEIRKFSLISAIHLKFRKGGSKLLRLS
jgi:hypothetical protein